MMDLDEYLAVMSEIKQHVADNPDCTAINISCLFDIDVSEASRIITEVIADGETTTQGRMSE